MDDSTRSTGRSEYREPRSMKSAVMTSLVTLNNLLSVYLSIQAIRGLTMQLTDRRVSDFSKFQTSKELVPSAIGGSVQRSSLGRSVICNLRSLKTELKFSVGQLLHHQALDRIGHVAKYKHTARRRCRRTVFDWRPERCDHILKGPIPEALNDVIGIPIQLFRLYSGDIFSGTGTTIENSPVMFATLAHEHHNTRRCLQLGAVTIMADVLERNAVTAHQVGH